MKTSRQSDFARIGRTNLPQEQAYALHRAIRLEWVTIAYYVLDATLLFLVLGSSQAMRAAWIQDLLAFLPPIAFLVATRFINRRPTGEHPYGFYRATGVAHLVAAVALVTMGAYLIVDSALGLATAEHPTIGSITLFGQTFWLGWPMILVLMFTGLIPVFLGRAKMKAAKKLHDKVLYADAQMNKADWMTSAAAIAGIIGIGIGWWWADAVAAILISLDILTDGIRNLRGALAALMDRRAKTYDDSELDPVSDRIDDYLRSLDWTAEAKSRVRDQGHVYHIESFVVPQDGRSASLELLEKARIGCMKVDWKAQDIVIVPVATLPEEFLPDPTAPGDER